ncbi:Vomp family autotransporter [Bartonella sp. AU15XJBT]|uniref:Vomp family autotransporter n=1 Tax=Bartonella sp. AU15XJBT TaxID=3019087 RepID=UPI0023618CF4|nr:Vomp family autotransporter [Bartonella sp. AU15XJBT]
MKKKYSTPNLIKAVSLSAAMATLLSSVSPVFAANLAITGGANLSTSGTGVSYAHGSHGSVVLVGDDDYCGADNVVGRGGKQQQGVADNKQITAEEQYNRFINGYTEGNGRNPYDVTTNKVTWQGDGLLTNNATYMGPAGSKGFLNAMPEAYGVYSFATGCGSAATGNYSTVFGAGATAKAGGAQAFGVSALASGKASVAMGVGSEASGESTVAIGGLATASGYNSVALGLKTKATKDYTVAIGSKAEAQALGSIAIGGGEPADNGQERKVIAKGKNSIAIGSHTYAEMAHSVAIGINAQVRVIDGVAVGGGSVSRIDSKVAGYDPVTNAATKKTSLAWKSTGGDFSVGNTEQQLTRQITNVAAGTKDTDAVNVAQLKALRDVASGAWKLSANDKNPTDVNPGSIIDFSVKNKKPEGKDNLTIERETKENKHKVQFTLNDNLKLTSVTTGQSTMSDDGFIINNGPRVTIDGFTFADENAPSMTVDGIDAGNKKITNVADATQDHEAVNYKQLKEIKEATKTTWQLAVNGGNATAIGPNGLVNFTAVGQEGKKNINIAKDNNHNVIFDLAENITVKSVVAGETIMNENGFGFAGDNKPRLTSGGIIAGYQKITAVADGEDLDDAVNFSQLLDVKEIAEKGWKLSVDGNNATDVKAGGTVDLVAAESEDGSKNIKIAKDNSNKVIFSLNDTLKLTSVTTGNSIMDNNGFGFVDGGPKITMKGIDAGNKKITKVKAGTDDTDAVNFKQLKDFTAGVETGWKLSVDGNNATDVKAGGTVDLVAAESEDGSKNIKIAKDNSNKVTFSLNDTLKLTSVTTGNSIMDNNGFGFVNGGPKITINGIDAGNKKITKVADGEDNTDAVNFKQLKDVRQLAEKGWKLSVDGNNATDVTAGSTVDLIAVKHKDDDNNESENTNIKIVKNEDNQVSFDLSEYIKVGRVETGLSSMSNAGFMIKDGPNMTKGGIYAANTKITGVQKGTNANDAVNVSQLNEIKDQIVENSLVKWDEDKKLITIGTEKGGTRIDVTGTDGKRTIAGVKDGEISNSSTEAINGSQINKISGDIAKFFGGNAAFEDGAFVGPQYNLSIVSADGKVEQKVFDNVGDALTGLDANVKNVNNHIQYVDKKFDDKFDKFSQDALLWSEEEGAFVALHGPNGEKTVSKITYLLDGDITKDSTDAVNGSQIHYMGSDIADYFGGKTSFEDGVFIGPRYNLSEVGVDGKVKQKEHNNVGDALIGLDANIKNVNQNLINSMNDVASYFGGGAGYDKNGEWHAPTFQVYHIEDNGTVSKKPYDNVADAFEGVNNTFTNIHNQISDITKNSLVKQEGEDGLITVGKETGGTEISIVNKDGEERTLSGVKDGMISQTSTEAINGSQLFKTNENVKTVTDNLSKVAQNTSKYFGGSTDVLNGIEPSFLIQGKPYNNVTDAFTGVNTSITNIDNKISDVVKNSLVKQDGISDPITIGKDTAGTEINIAGYGKVARSISGVKAAEKGDEAVNKDQLDKSIKDITKDIETVTAAAVLYDKNDDGSVNYGSVTLGGDKNNGPVALHNVKDGSISQDSHDAINGSQINKISEDVAKFFGGGAKFVDGAFKGLKYTLSAIVDGKVGKANFYDVGSALDGLDNNVQDVNKRLTNVSNEFNQKIEGISKDALLWDDEEEAFVARHEKDGKKTNSKLKYLLDGEIADGSTDAITGNQLYFMSNQLANYFGGGAKYENGKWTDPTFKISKVDKDGKTVETEHHNVADAFGDINDGMSNINNRIDDVINKVDSDALKWNDKEKAYDAGRDGKPNKIINVADGKIEKGSKDAVNGGQLWETNERVAGVEKDVKHLNNRVDNISNTIADIGDTVINIDAKVDNIDNKVNDIAEDAVRYDRDENGKKTNKITLAGGDASEPVLIDNVADGKIEKGSKEAVNGGQLHDYTQEQMKIILDESKHYTDQRVNNIVIDAIDDAVDRSKQYTDMKFDVLNYSIESVKKEARQAAAIGLAVSNLRYNDTPGKLSVGFGTGLWRSQSAFAFGAGYTSENGKFRSNVSATTSGGHWGVGAGFNMTLN